MSDIIGVITKVEDDDYQGKAHKKVTIDSGQVLKVKYGREGALKAKWGLLQEGKAIKFIMRDFTTGEGVKIPFVFDIESAGDSLPPAKEPELLSEEYQKVIDEVVRTVPPKPPKPSNEADERIRSMAMSYAKDMVTNKVISPDKLFSYAEAIYRYIKADITVTDEAVFKELMGKHFNLN